MVRGEDGVRSIGRNWDNRVEAGKGRRIACPIPMDANVPDEEPGLGLSRVNTVALVMENGVLRCQVSLCLSSESGTSAPTMNIEDIVMAEPYQEWLMVIDHQPAFAHPDSPWFCPAMVDVAPKIARLVPLYGDRIIFTRFVPPQELFGSWVDYYRRWDFALNPSSDWLWDLSDEWKGRPSISNHTFSKWIDAARTQLGPSPRVSMCGVSTACCVLATACAAVDDGAQVRIIADACAAASDDIHNDALKTLALLAPQLSIATTDDECRRLNIAA